MCNYINFFFFNDTATTEIYTLSLHDALPIFRRRQVGALGARSVQELDVGRDHLGHRSLVAVLVGEAPALQAAFHLDQPADRKSTRLNSSHANISYAVFCLKKKTP